MDLKSKIKSLIITGYGINCEEELASAYRLSEAICDISHISSILSGEISIHNYDVLNFPGGFSFGDNLGSGKVLANKIFYRKLSNGKPFTTEIDRFLDEGKYIIGICNGFQALVKMGLLPAIKNRWLQEVSLFRNSNFRFIDKWCKLKLEDEQQIISMPIRHGEGRLIIKDDEIKQEIIRRKLNFISYYGENPNGSELNCAGLTDVTGRVIGMMPHPEAFLSMYNNPEWGTFKRDETHPKADGLEFIRKLVAKIELSANYHNPNN